MDRSGNKKICKRIGTAERVEEGGGTNCGVDTQECSKMIQTCKENTREEAGKKIYQSNTTVCWLGVAHQ